MNRKILALATAAALVAPAIASANPTVYGRAHLSVDLLDNGADSALNVSSNSSRLGFRGNHDLDYGLKAIYQIEQQINFDTEGDQFATRDTFAGVEGAFGMVRLGKIDTPYKVLRGRVDLFGDQVGDARNITGALAVGEQRFRNGIHYRTPTFGGVFADLHYSTNTNDVGGTDNNDQDAYSASLTYRSGPIYAAVAYELQNLANGDDRSAVRASASYDMGALRLTALAQQGDINIATGDSATAFGVGARYSLGNTALKGQFYMLSDDRDDHDAQMVAVGVDHRLARNFTGYVNYAMMMNDDNVGLTPYSQARTASPSGTAGETSSGLSVGMIYNF